MPPPQPITKDQFSLSQEEVARLLNEPSAQSRIDVMGKVADEYNAGSFDPKELAVAEQIFRLLLRDTEMRVRSALAGHLKDNPRIPRDIIVSLCKDVEEVSLPVIQVSEVLTDNDLLEIIRRGTSMAQMLAIADRKKVSPRISTALIETLKREVVSRLVKNPGAQIPEAGYQRIMEAFANQEAILTDLVGRANLPVTVVEKLITLVSETLGAQLEKKYNLGVAKLAYETEQSRELATLKLLEESKDPEAAERLVRQLAVHGRLTLSIITTALCRGNMRFFELSMARLGRIPERNARALIHDRGPLGFKALYAHAQLPESMFAAIRLALKAVQTLQEEGSLTPGTPRYANRLASQLLQAAEGQKIENLPYILALIRQS